MSTQHRANTNPVRIHADHAAQKRLGDWTTARAFEVCARHAEVVIDLRSPQIPDGEIQLNLDLDHTTLIDHSAWLGPAAERSSRPTTTRPAPAAGSS
jgi:hypothetical protein